MENLPDVPRVWLTSRHRDDGDQILPGNEAAGIRAAEFLLERVEGPIAYLNPAPLHPALRRRCDAFEFTLNENHRECLRINAPTNTAGARNRLDLSEAVDHARPLVGELIRFAPRIEGLFIPCDMWTAVIHPLLEPMKKPRPLVISCGGEQAFLAGLEPRPASIDLDQTRLGHRAVDQLFARIHQREQVASG